MTVGMIFYVIAVIILFLGGIGSTALPNSLNWGILCIALGLLLEKVRLAIFSKTSSLPTFTPALNQQVPVDSSGRVPVTVHDNGNNNNVYFATISNMAGAAVGSGSLSRQSGGPPFVYSGNIGAGTGLPTAPGSNNRIASVQGSQAGISAFSGAQDFNAYTSGSISHALETTAAQVAKVFQAGQPVPHAMHLRLDAPGGESFPAGNPSPQPILLVHAPDPAQISWFSEPLQLDGEAASPGFWQLQKWDPRTWLLKLQRGNNLLVTYRHTTAAEKDGSLPIRLEIVEPGTGVIEGWPRTATVSAAP